MQDHKESDAGAIFEAAWTTPFEAPPFDRIVPSDFRPAFARALAAHKSEVAAIAGSAAAPTFGNTIDALERAGGALDRVSSVFFNLTGANTNDEIQAIEREMSPVLARHSADFYADAKLFARIDTLYEARAGLGLTPEQVQILARIHTDFVRAGARLDDAGKGRFKAIMEELAGLSTQFAQNVLADERAFALFLEDEGDLKGLPGFVREAAAAEAEARGRPGAYAITLSRSSIEPFMQFSTRRDLREAAFEGWTRRGDAGAHDNKPLIQRIVRLRIELANLLGYETFAAFKLDDRMAKTPKAARGLLERVWPAARARAEEEKADLQKLVEEEGQNFELKASDWLHYAEKLRRARFAISEEEIKPYFQLENMIAAAFDVANRLFGLTFEPRTDVPVYHPDVRVWEVKRGDETVGLFYGDYFARGSKRSGAWMSAFRSQEKLRGNIRPLIVNVCNFVKAPPGKPALLSLTDARTLFHEFGHALHGLLSDVTYPSLAGTSVARDFVELPSQLYEHWLLEPAVLVRFARHAETGAPIPDDLVGRILKARHFNQGFATVEFVSSALVDMALHELTDADDLDVVRFEKEALGAIGMPAEITMRHRTPHFAHIFSGDGYAAGYYSYLWSEVLDADGFGAFKEAGDPFDKETAERLHRYIYSAGGSADPAELYRAFRGRDPGVEPLLEGRGLNG